MDNREKQILSDSCHKSTDPAEWLRFTNSWSRCRILAGPDAKALRGAATPTEYCVVSWALTPVGWRISREISLSGQGLPFRQISPTLRRTCIRIFAGAMIYGETLAGKQKVAHTMYD